MSIHLVRVSFDLRKLLSFGAQQKLTRGVVDWGYLFHAALLAAFPGKSPRSFKAEHTTHSQRSVRLLAYYDSAAVTLRQASEAFASPEASQLVLWDSFASKEMPTQFTPGARLGFEVRACPIIRIASDRVPFKKGQEVDAFVAAAHRNPDEPIDRGQIYGQWAKGQFETRSGLAVESVAVKSFQIAPVFRKTSAHGGSERVGKPVKVPDVLFEGVLRVGTADGVQQLLSRGIGRHRGFGFGMVLLKPGVA